MNYSSLALMWQDLPCKPIFHPTGTQQLPKSKSGVKRLGAPLFRLDLQVKGSKTLFMRKVNHTVEQCASNPGLTLLRRDVEFFQPTDPRTMLDAQNDCYVGGRHDFAAESSNQNEPVLLVGQ